MVRVKRHGATWLRSTNGGYRLSKIVPSKSGILRPNVYNAVLGDFVLKVAEPAARNTGFSVWMSAPGAKLEDWLSAEVAQALNGFLRTQVNPLPLLIQ